MSTPPLLPAGFTAEPDDQGAWWISRHSVYVGVIFPQVVPEPGGRWFARLAGQDAHPCRDQASASAYIVNHTTDQQTRLAEENR